MKLKQIIDELGVCPIYLKPDAGEAEVAAAYCGDLMSDVLAHVPTNAIWFTIQAHVNVIAIAQLREVACIVLVNGVTPDPQTVIKAKSQGINLCGSEATSAQLCMQLAGKL